MHIYIQHEQDKKNIRNELDNLFSKTRVFSVNQSQLAFIK